MKKKGSLIIVLAGLIVYILLLFLLLYFEKANSTSNLKDFLDTFWYSIVTLTTVGYGDRYPVTLGGRGIAIILMIAGIGILGIIIGNLTNKMKEYMEKSRLGLLGTDFANHIIAVGWDDFSRQVIQQIAHVDKQVAVVTNIKSNVDIITGYFDDNNVHVLFADINNFDILSKVNIDKASTVFINLQNDTDTLVYFINVKKKYPSLKYVVSLNNVALKDTFVAAGVSYCIAKEEISSKLVASYIFEPNVAELIDDIMATTKKHGDYDVKEYKITANNPYLEKNYLDVFIELKTKYNIVLLGINKLINGKRELVKNATKEITIELNDALVLMMDEKTHILVDKIFNTEEG